MEHCQLFVATILMTLTLQPRINTPQLINLPLMTILVILSPRNLTPMAPLWMSFEEEDDFPSESLAPVRNIVTWRPEIKN